MVSYKTINKGRIKQEYVVCIFYIIYVIPLYNYIADNKVLQNKILQFVRQMLLLNNPQPYTIHFHHKQ